MLCYHIKAISEQRISILHWGWRHFLPAAAHQWQPQGWLWSHVYFLRFLSEGIWISILVVKNGVLVDVFWNHSTDSRSETALPSLGKKSGSGESKQSNTGPSDHQRCRVHRPSSAEAQHGLSWVAWACSWGVWKFNHLKLQSPDSPVFFVSCFIGEQSFWVPPSSVATRGATKSVWAWKRDQQSMLFSLCFFSVSFVVRVILAVLMVVVVAVVVVVLRNCHTVLLATHIIFPWLWMLVSIMCVLLPAQKFLRNNRNRCQVVASVSFPSTILIFDHRGRTSNQLR